MTEKKQRLFDISVIGDAKTAIDLVSDVLESSTEYSIIAQDLNGMIVLWNEGARRIYRYESEEVINKMNISALSTPEDVEQGRLKKITDEVLKKGKFEGTITRVRKNGNRFVSHLVITARHNASGNPIGFLIISKDLSGEAAIVQHVRTLVNTTLDILMIIDLKGKIIDVNAALVRATGVSREKLIGADFFKYFTDPQKARDAYKKAIEKGVVIDYSLIFQHSDGNLIDVLCNFSIYKDYNETVLGIFFAARDITDLKHAEGKFQKLLESVPDAILLVEKQGGIILINAQTEKLFGYKREELLGQKVEVLIPERYRANHPSKRDGFFASPHARIMGAGLELHGLRKDGTEFPVEISLTPFETPEGIFALSAIRDVTAQKQMQAQLIKQHDEAIEKMVALERFQKLTVGRELRMIELKQEVETLKNEIETLKKRSRE